MRNRAPDNRRVMDYLKGRADSQHVLRGEIGFNATYRRSCMLEAGGYRTDFVCFEDHEIFARMKQYGATGYTGPEARVYASARREEHKGIRGLLVGSMRHKIRTRLQRLGIVQSPLEVFSAKAHTFGETRYPPIR